MKITTTILSLVFITSTVFAGNSPERASSAERNLMCTAVNTMMEQNMVDAGLNTKKCLKGSIIVSTLAHEGVRNLVGQLTFNSPSMKNFKRTCTFSYMNGVAQIKNIIGGLDSVSCE